MDFFEKLGDTILTTGRDVTQKAKDLSGVAKLKLDIKTKEDFVEKQYAAIGKKYYEQHKDDEVIDFAECTVIEEALEAIKDMKAQMSDLKGSQRCPRCGAEVALDADFCSACGMKLDDQFEEE